MVTADLVLFMTKSILRKKSGTSHQEIPSLVQLSNAMILQVVTKWSLRKVKGEENFIPLG